MSENINEVVKEEVATNENAEAATLERDEADLALVKRKAIFDKITTGLLILLMCAPFAILAYIIIWFLNP